MSTPDEGIDVAATWSAEREQERAALMTPEELGARLEYVASAFHAAHHGLTQAPDWKSCDRHPCKVANRGFPALPVSEAAEREQARALEGPETAVGGAARVLVEAIRAAKVRGITPDVVDRIAMPEVDWMRVRGAADAVALEIDAAPPVPATRAPETAGRDPSELPYDGSFDLG